MAKTTQRDIERQENLFKAAIVALGAGVLWIWYRRG